MRPLTGLNKAQITKLSDMFSDAGMVAFATVVLPSLFDKVDENRVVLGWSATVLCWFASLFLRRK